jgi:hypothetical protein
MGCDWYVLLQVMQVKNFGRRGRTKHTHLVDVDTSKFEELLVPEARPLREKLEKKLTGTEQVFNKPRKTKT